MRDCKERREGCGRSRAPSPEGKQQQTGSTDETSPLYLGGVFVYGGSSRERQETVRISTANRYGPLQDGFAFELGEGYRVLVGRNNSGKSAILQLVFKTLMRDNTFGPDKICLLLTDRDYVQSTTEPGGSNLSSTDRI